jgi:hypothetical protein
VQPKDDSLVDQVWGHNLNIHKLFFVFITFMSLSLQQINYVAVKVIYKVFVSYTICDSIKKIRVEKCCFDVYLIGYHKMQMRNRKKQQGLEILFSPFLKNMFVAGAVKHIFKEG